MTLRRLASTDSGFQTQLSELLAFESAQDPGVDVSVAAILDEVQNNGDAALIEFTRRFDRWTPTSVDELEIPFERRQESLEKLPPMLRAALNVAAERIRRYHERQRAESWQYTEPDGTVLGQKIT